MIDERVAIRNLKKLVKDYMKHTNNKDIGSACIVIFESLLANSNYKLLEGEEIVLKNYLSMVEVELTKYEKYK